jgi:hypothetical protein
MSVEPNARDLAVGKISVSCCFMKFNSWPSCFFCASGALAVLPVSYLVAGTVPIQQELTEQLNALL